MEMLDTILDLAKMIFAPIHDYCNNHRHFDEHMKKLGDTKKELNSRKSDIESRMKVQLRPGMTLKSEVDTWLQAVERMINEIQAIESEAEEVKWFLRARIGKHALEKKPEADELYQKGGDFPDSLVIDPPVRNGEEFPTTKLIGKSTTERVKEKILAYVLGNDVRKIGVYGMGGIGKSTIMEHINNHLLKDNKKFSSVIWVTVSKSSDVLQLQNAIAHKLALDLAKSEYKRERAAKIKEELEKKEKYVLILDDLWKGFSLEEVGIPEPTPENGCKIVLTTQDRNVCKKMGCEDIGMKLLSKEEARELFLHKIEKDVFNTPNLKAIAEDVLQRCAQLPLAIVATAASFKCLDYEYQWTDALDQLSTSLKGFDNIEEQVHEVLKFSYVRLKEEKLKQCLLHCALYPEDFKIDKEELIDHLIDEGIFERRKSRQLEFCGGYSILKRLENASLLEGGIDAPYYYEEKLEFVKMHDLIRDMVLQVASPEFVAGHLGLEDFSGEGKWKEDLVKASLMYKDISTIPSYISPRCPNLSTLLLQGNRSLKNVPDSLFEHLHGLKVLDLSYTGIKSLPNSVFSLEKLTALRLRGCRRLKHMSSLAKLTALRKLDLGETEITEVPDGLEMLVNLTYLNLNAKNLEIMPLGILPKLSCLQYLRFSCIVVVKTEEIERLKKLENVWVRFDDLYERAASAWVLSDTFSSLKVICIYVCPIKKLLPLGLLLHLRNLEEIKVEGRFELKEIIGEASDEFEEEEKEEEGMDTTKITLPSLRVLVLRWLPELKTICSKVIVCASLETIYISNCPKLKRLPLSLPLLSNGQPSLQRIQGEKAWWDSLEWDCPDTKNVLQPFFIPLLISRLRGPNEIHCDRKPGRLITSEYILSGSNEIQC